MAFFDDLKKNFSNVSDQVMKSTETARKKSESAIEVQKAKFKKSQLENKLKDLYAEIGLRCFELGSCPGMPEDIVALFDEVKACMAAIEEADQKCADLKGKTLCSDCGKEVDKEASFCPSCGAAIVHVVEAEAEEEEVFAEIHDAEEAVEEAVEEAAEVTAEAAEEAVEE